MKHGNWQLANEPQRLLRRNFALVLKAVSFFMAILLISREALFRLNRLAISIAVHSRDSPME
jgi:hypothetical protein